MPATSIDEGHRLIERSIAIELLEQRIADLQHHNQTLLVHNNELLDRARLAEGRLKAICGPV